MRPATVLGKPLQIAVDGVPGTTDATHHPSTGFNRAIGGGEVERRAPNCALPALSDAITSRHQAQSSLSARRAINES
jgi:hypothetical protein